MELPLLEQIYNHSTSVLPCKTGKGLFNPFRRTLIWCLACPVLWDKVVLYLPKLKLPVPIFILSLPVLFRAFSFEQTTSSAQQLGAISTSAHKQHSYRLLQKTKRSTQSNQRRSSLAALKGQYSQVGSSWVGNCSISPSLFNHLIKSFVKWEQTTKSTPHLPLPWQKRLTFSLGYLPPSHELS